MRNYPNGGFFFIDAAPIQAAGENGLKIPGIFEDAKRAIEGGKVGIITGLIDSDDKPVGGVMATIYYTENDIQIGGLDVVNTANIIISDEDIATIES